MRRWYVFTLPAFMASIARAGGAAFDVEGAVRHALEHNPDVLAAAADVSAATARQRQAALWLQANPQVEAAAGPRDAGHTTTDYSVSLSQEVEIGGQHAARGEAARAGLDAARARLAWRRVEVAAAVREAFGRVLAAQRHLEITRDGETAAQEAMDAAEKRFRAGDIARIEVNAARIERGRSARERGRAEQRAAAALSELQLLLALPPGETMAVRGELTGPSTEPLEALPALIARAVRDRGDLVAARAELEGARAESALASRVRVPNPRFGVSFEHEEGAGVVQGVLGFELPAFDRNQAGRGAAAARVVQAEQALHALELRAEQEVRLAHLAVQTAHEAASAYAGEIVEAMRENLDLASRAYQAKQIDFTQLLLIRRDSLEAQRGYVDTLAELNSARAELRRALGAE